MSSQDPRSLKRTHNNPNQDPNLIDNNAYNDQAGVKKVSDFGKHLLPFEASAGVFTTDFSTSRKVGRGKAMAFYNNSASVAAVTMSSATVALALAPGATNAAGDVGIPVAANSWLYLNTFDNDHVRTTASTCLGFIISDDTEMK